MRTTPSMVPRAQRTAGSALRTRQGGYGVLIALVILVLGSLYGLTRGLSQATAQTRHDDHDQAVLRQARDALVAWAALHPTKPGSLPCPDTDDDGTLNQNFAACNAPVPGAAPAPIGRLPWKTLGIPDLRDSSGERLWYVVANSFRHITASALNSDSRGQLSVTGLAPQSEVIAIVFAPGAALGGQDRSAAGRNLAANYLEGENGDATNDTFAALTACLASGCPSGPVNDKLLVIRAIDLFPVVENMVAKRMQTELRDAMYKEGAAFADKGHFQRWRDHAGVLSQGYFPFAAPFVQPDTSNFQGVWNTSNGLMPVAKDATFVQWQLGASGPSVVEETPGPNVLNSGTPACSVFSTGDQIQCDVLYTAFTAPRIRITGYALNVATSFVDPVQLTDVTVSFGGGNVLPPVTNTHVTAALPLPLQGSAQIDVVVGLAPRGDSDTNPTTIVVPKPRYNATIVGPNWFINNNWHRVSLYSVAPAATTALPKDVGTGGPDCLLAGADCRDALNTANGGAGRHLVLLLAGLPVDSNTPRPAAGLNRYLEGRNVWTSGAHTPPNQFETYLRASGRNDKLAVIAP